jgi:hypothetical protein
LTDVVVKLTSNSRTFLLVRLDEFLIHFGKGFFRLLDAGDVLGKEKNPSLRSVGVPPRPHFPMYPYGAAFTIPAIFVGSQCFSL